MVRNIIQWVGFLMLITGSQAAFASDAFNMPCEIFEASSALQSASQKINGVRYLLIHQANSADREKFSEWLKSHSGSDVTFTFNEQTYRGALCRLAHCFGRGLLLFTGPGEFKKRNIIEVTMPE